MSSARISGPQRTVAVDRGLFLVKYANAEDRTNPPIVRIFGADRALEMLSHPDDEHGVLRRPGSVLVVRVITPGQLVIEVTPQIPNGSVAASVSLRPLPELGETQAPTLVEPLPSRHSSTAGLRICGHVAGRGDVIVAPDEWIAGPSAPSRIEGLAVDWPNMPAGVNLRYAVQFAGPQRSSSPLTDVGGFAGTRRRALPLSGVILELSGPAAKSFRITAEALFLGAPVSRQEGQRVVLSGATGREPLVGLKLAVEDMTPAAVSVPAIVAAPQAITPSSPQLPATPVAEDALPVKRTGRVRVFRSTPGSRASEG